jgi:hypothetical protein
MNEPPIDYAGRDTPDDVRRRSLGTWAMLLVIWSIGLLVWAVYIGAAVYLFFRIFS